MNVIFVVNHPREFACDIPGADVVSASTYLTDPAYGEDAPCAGPQPLPRRPLSGPGLLRVAAGRGARPQPAAGREGDPRSADGRLRSPAERRDACAGSAALADCADDTVRRSMRISATIRRQDRCSVPAAVSELRVPLLACHVRARARSNGGLREMRILSAGRHSRCEPRARRRIRDGLHRQRTGTRARKSSSGGAVDRDPVQRRRARSAVQCPKALQKFVRAAEALGHAAGDHRPRRYRAAGGVRRAVHPRHHAASTTTPISSRAARRRRAWW